MQKIFIVLLTLFFIFTINTKAQQNECPQFEWVEALTTSGSLTIFSSCIDVKGYNYLAGVYEGVASIGNFILPSTSQGMGTSWVAKFDTLGNCIWATYAIGAYFRDIEIDYSGNLHIVGEAFTLNTPNLIFQQDTIYGITNGGFFAKLDTAGTLQWMEHHPNLHHLSILVSSTNNIHLLSLLKDTSIFNTQTIMPTNGEPHFACIKLNQQLQIQWVAQAKVGGTSNGHGNSWVEADIDDAGNIYIVGALPNIGPINIGSTTLNVANNTNEGVVAKINGNSGEFEWAKQIESTYFSVLKYITILNNEQLFALGTFKGTADFGNNITRSTSFNNTSQEEVFMVQIDANGGNFQHVMLTGLIYDNNLGVNDFKSDNDGYLYMVGLYNGTKQFGDSIFQSQSYDAFISKILPQQDTFKTLWTLSSQGTAYEALFKMSVVSSKDIYISGIYADGVCELGSHSLQGANSTTYVFLSKIINDCSLPTEEIANPLQLVTIYPNPAHTNITINNLPHNSTIHITDISGRVLYTQYNKNNSTLQIPVNGISNGMYFVQIINGEHRVNKKVVVER